MSEREQPKIAFFAKTNFRNQERVFGIKEDDRRRHMYIVGKTGMGKTNLLENLAIQDIQAGHGICFIDPHGDVAQKLITAIPPERVNDVIYFDPADQNFPIAFNILEQVAPDQRSLVASGLVGVFKKIWADSWGPRLEYILRNAILALLEYPGSTLLGVMRILVDKSYRERVIDQVTDPVVKAFWRDEFSAWSERVLQEVISPIQNKVGQFTSNSLIRNIIGQRHTSFNVREIMDQRKILIMNLAKGKIGEDATALLGAMMITKIQLAAMGRVDIEEAERADFYLYVDEFQNFATESFANILSEARKYRLCLILANQYITQIDEKVIDAVFGNAGTIITFRVGATDAEFLEKEFEPVFMMNDLVNLPKYHIYLKLMIDGIAGDAFSATTLPPITLGSAENKDKIIRISRERYASSKEEVEDKIRRWSGMLTEAETRVALGQNSARSMTALSPRPAARSSAPPSRSSRFPQRGPTAIQRSAPAPGSPAVRGISPVSPAVTSAEPRGIAPPKPTSPPATPELPKISSAAHPAAPPTQAVSATTPAPIAPSSSEAAPAERMLYPATCATCGLAIEVPFKPEASRPTFCRDCLRDYQRAVAKAKQSEERKQGLRSGQPSGHQSPTPAPAALERRTEHRVYSPNEKPMSLSQASYVAPKKFKPLKKKPDINLSEVRSLIDAARTVKDEA